MEYKVIEYTLKKKGAELNQEKITVSRDANKFAHKFYHEDIEIYESMFLILLNRTNMVTGYAKISQGGTAGTVVDIKLIANYAVRSLSNSVILVHNHPSGNEKPSQQDVTITKKLRDALKLLDVTLLDHVIVTADQDTFFSMVDNGYI